MFLSFDAYDPNFAHLGAIEFETADLMRVQNDVGIGTVTGVRGVDLSRLTRDAILVSTYAEGGRVDTVGRSLWFVRRRSRQIVSRTTTASLLLADSNHVLKRRIVAYKSGSSQASKTGQASALMVDFVRQQFTTATDTTRLAPLLVPDATAYGTTQTASHAFDDLLDALKDISDAEGQAGNWLGFGVEPANLDGTGIDQLALTFQTYANQRGVDRRGQFSLSAAAGSLASITIDDDWSDEATRIYVGGAGQGSARLVADATRDNVGALGPFGLVEDWLDATNLSIAANVANKANAELYNRRGVTRFRAPLVFGSFLRWGVNIGFGDRVYVNVDDILTDARVASYGVSVSPERGTQVQATVEGVI